MPHKPPPHTKQTATSADLEWGTDSLSRIYRSATPGQEDAGITFPKEDIIKTGNQYKLVSKSSGKNLGTYDTKADAKKRERQVQYFKQQENAVMETFLTELGNRPYPWRIRERNSERYRVQFTIPETGIIYEAELWATKMSAYGGPGHPGFRGGGVTRSPLRAIEYEFGFGLAVGKSNRMGEYDWDDSIVGKTGVEIPVFATVVAIFKEMIKDVKPLKVVYSAKIPSRQRLYSRFTKMVQRVIPGYKGFEVKSGSYEVRRDGYVPEERIIPSFLEYLRESDDATPPMVTDVPPPEMESWMRKNKASYVKQHGEETGMVRLTAAAWDIHNRENAERDS